MVKEITNALHISALGSSRPIARPTTVSLNERYLVFTPAPIVSKVGTIKVGTVPKHISEIPTLGCEKHSLTIYVDSEEICWSASFEQSPLLAKTTHFK